MPQRDETAVARVNGVPLHGPGERVAADELRQRACTELLRQAAIRDGLLASDSAPTTEGVLSDEAAHAIERWLEQTLRVPEPSDDACRRHYGATAARYRTGERARVRHILFAVTPGVEVNALRRHAEACLLQVRCAEDHANEFGAAARRLSNCPSGEAGGELGWLTPSDIAPEVAREIFGRSEIGVLPRLVHSRFGLHVIEVIERDGGVQQPFEQVRQAVALSLTQRSWVTALRQALKVLAGEATLQGVSLDAADDPLVQ